MIVTPVSLDSIKTEMYGIKKENITTVVENIFNIEKEIANELINLCTPEYLKDCIKKSIEKNHDYFGIIVNIDRNTGDISEIRRDISYRHIIEKPIGINGLSVKDEIGKYISKKDFFVHGAYAMIDRGYYCFVMYISWSLSSYVNTFIHRFIPFCEYEESMNYIM